MSAAGSARSDRPEGHCARRLEQVFDSCFRERYRTVLVGGAPEPLYRPASSPGGVSHLYYREDYFASALHEVAHWCIAGEARRAQVDFGYWYVADGRNTNAQRDFEAVEYKPQALEWFFSQASAWSFSISVDNLDGSGAIPDTRVFASRVAAQACHWRGVGLPERAAVFFEGLCGEFGTFLRPCELEFSTAALQ